MSEDAGIPCILTRETAVSSAGEWASETPRPVESQSVDTYVDIHVSPPGGYCTFSLDDSVQAASVHLTLGTDVAAIPVISTDMTKVIGARCGCVLVHGAPSPAVLATGRVDRVRFSDGKTKGWEATCEMTLSVTPLGGSAETRVVRNKNAVFLSDAVWREWKLDPAATMFIPFSLLLVMGETLRESVPGKSVLVQPLRDDFWAKRKRK